MNRVAPIAILSAALLVVAGCSARSGPPLSYLALKRPEGPVTTGHGVVEEKHVRGGWYFGNHNFRPAPDIQTYLEQANEHTGSETLRDADIELAVPFAFDILFFGYNSATDKLTAMEPKGD